MQIRLTTPGSTFAANSFLFSNWSNSSDQLIILGSIGSEFITAAGLANTTIYGGAGADTLVGGNADNRFVYYAQSDIVAGELANGSGGNDTLVMAFGNGTAALSSMVLSSIEALELFSAGGGLSVELTSAQVANDLAPNLHITTDVGTDFNIQIAMGVSANVDLRGWTFDSVALHAFGTFDRTNVVGDIRSNTFYGSSVNDAMYGGEGNDFLDGELGANILDGGDNDDIIVWDAADSLALLTGGSGTDTLRVRGISIDGAFNVAGHQFENIEFTGEGVNLAQWTQLLTAHVNSGLPTFESVPIAGGRRDISWHALNAQIYAFAEEDFNLANQRTALRSYYDDGSRRTIGYDVANAKPDASYEEDHKADDARQALRTYYDDGTWRRTNYDTTGLSRTTSEEDFSADNQRLAIRTYNDDGTRHTTLFDPAGASNWSLIEEYYENANQRYR